METVGILIQAPKEVQIEIEEYCIANGKDFTKYFLELHERRKLNASEHKEKGGKWEDDEEEPKPQAQPQKGKKK